MDTSIHKMPTTVRREAKEEQVWRVPEDENSWRMGLTSISGFPLSLSRSAVRPPLYRGKSGGGEWAMSCISCSSVGRCMFISTFFAQQRRFLAMRLQTQTRV